VPTVAEDVIHAVRRHQWGDIAPGLLVGVSAGQAAGTAREVDRLMRDADDNLYRAKAAGRGRGGGPKRVACGRSISKDIVRACR
jgi:GGDEF domain-containing protein